MNAIKLFQKEKKENIEELTKINRIQGLGVNFISEVEKYKYSYNFTWMGRPIIQFPQDIIAMQEIIWQIKPDLIIETGIAHGGTLIFYASMLELIGKGEVLGIDIDIRPHNRVEIEKHLMFKRIKMLEGSSIADKIFLEVEKISKKKKIVLVALDSNHSHNHVLRELKLYSTLVTMDSYLVVFDTIIEDLPEDFYLGKPWSKGNNPKTAILEFLKNNHHFVVDKNITNKLVITTVPHGYLKRVS